MNTKLLIIALAILFILPSVSAATIHGTIYDTGFDILEGVLITINTVPEQAIVSIDGEYTLEVDPGDYTIIFEYYEGTELIYSSEENISIIDNGEYLRDVILLPALENGEIINIEEIYGENERAWWILGIVMIAIALIYIYLKYFRKKETKTELDEDDAEKVKEFIKKSKGRTTQKEIRKNLAMSEAKASLIVTELEHKGIVTRIKKGRANVIILNK